MMKTVGALLKEARESQQKTTEDIANHIKIREDFLVAIERDEFNNLPKGPFIKGFLQAYAEAVALDPDHIIAVYRRDFGQKEKAEILPKGLLNPIRHHAWLRISAHVTAVLFVCVALFSFIVFEWISFTQPPVLTIVEPINQAQVKSPVVIRGRTATDAVVTINQVPVTLNQDGVFQTQRIFSPGTYVFTIEAKNRQGKTRTVQRTVTVIE